MTIIDSLTGIWGLFGAALTSDNSTAILSMMMNHLTVTYWNELLPGWLSTASTLMFHPNSVKLTYCFSVSSEGLAEQRSCVLHQSTCRRKFFQVWSVSKQWKHFLGYAKQPSSPVLLSKNGLSFKTDCVIPSFFGDDKRFWSVSKSF